MTKLEETVRTDKYIRVMGKAMPLNYKPKHCALHRVTWWIDEQALGETSECPCCNGKKSIFALSVFDEVLLKERRELQAVP